ncbi:MAG: hypothetical protein V3T65_00240 [Acidobacteriota bacterium]
MISPLLLEKPGLWRLWGVIVLFVAFLLPTIPLLWQSASSLESFTLGPAFWWGLQNSLLVALTVSLICLAVGLPLGVLVGLYAVPARRGLLALAALPLVVPSFLWAIGWSALAAHGGRSIAAALSGFAGCVLVFSALGIPLVLLSCYSATRRLTASQVEAARLSGGERLAFGNAVRYAVQPALMTSALAAVLTLSDPGPGFIFGLQTAAADILTSFSALYDFELAGRQCLVLAAAVLLLTGPLAAFAAPRLSSAVLPRQLKVQTPVQHRLWSPVTSIGFLLLLFLTVFLPLAGLILPLFKVGTQFGRAYAVASQTLWNTLLYAAGAGILAILSGFLLAFLVGRNAGLRTLCLALLVLFFSLPPALPALGLVQVGSFSPAWTDPLLRSRLTVAFALGVRFLPVAAVLALQAWAGSSPSWSQAAAVHGLSLGRYLVRILLLYLVPPAALAALLVALLATADVSTQLLLHPPGQRSFPLAIFTVMANAPQSLVASLCLLYVAAAGTLVVLLSFPGRFRA